LERAAGDANRYSKFLSIITSLSGIFEVFRVHATLRPEFLAHNALDGAFV
jgi:hypothetical protein